MSFPAVPSFLSQTGEDVVRQLFKTIRATRYEDPVDQDSFLIASANTVLSLRPQVMSFATVPELAECVFTIRSMMHSNNARLKTPISETFIHIQDFAGEIIRKRQLIRDRKHAQIDRIRAAEGVAARHERRLALEHAARVDNNKASRSLDEDAVSIPSTTDESGGEEPDPKVFPPIYIASPRLNPSQNPPASPITNDLTNIPANHQGKSLFIFILLSFTPLTPVVERAAAIPPVLPIFTKPIPTGPRAGLHAPAPQSSRKRRRVGEGENDGPQPQAQFFQGDSSRPVSHRSDCSAPVRSTVPPSEVQLRRRLAGVQAELHRLSYAQKTLRWQLQSLQQPEPSPPAGPQED
ncbi:hypothetical protein C8R44DRAFT_740682 [Mycena epipterygia]|nr:hypothetical protein C8R44DRAFT_740682 [Mycena epipterygia]